MHASVHAVAVEPQMCLPLDCLKMRPLAVLVFLSLFSFCWAAYQFYLAWRLLGFAQPSPSDLCAKAEAIPCTPRGSTAHK